jgi:hypothetical protein
VITVSSCIHRQQQHFVLFNGVMLCLPRCIISIHSCAVDAYQGWSASMPTPSQAENGQAVKARQYP